MNRYQELLAEIPVGSYYQNRSGVEILPRRSTPYEFRFPTDTPNTRYGIFVDGIFTGTQPVSLTAQRLCRLPDLPASWRQKSELLDRV